MKKSLLISTIAIVFCLGIVFSVNVYAQTAGTLTFKLTTTSTGGYSPNHLVAIWIENNAAAFVKTKVKYSSTGNLDHLAIWTSKSSSSVVDATTGATLTAHGTLTVNWDGTDVNGTLVPDGTYKVWVEMAWASSLTTGKTSTSFSFTKGSTLFHLAPADLTNFTGITLDWVPKSGTSVNNLSSNSNISLFPNPNNGIVNIDFKQTVSDCSIHVLNVNGKEVWNEFLKSGNGIKTIDLSKLPSGVYFISVRFGDNNLNYRIIKKD